MRLTQKLDGSACRQCRRRSWLLGELSGPLDYVARDRDRLMAVFALPDAELIQAVGGRRKAELTARYETFEPATDLNVWQSFACLCRHHQRYPPVLRDAGAPALLHTTTDGQRLVDLTAKPIVTLIGSAAPSDYGIAMADALARGLAASGVTVAGSATDGIPAAGLAGALRGDGAPLAIVGSGLKVPVVKRHAELLRDVMATGCAVSELPPECRGRRWGAIAGERILSRLAAVSVVVEAEENTSGLVSARMAQSHGTIVAAIPGRVTSRLSGGTNALLAEGAKLVRDAGDVLEIIYSSGTSPIEPKLHADRSTPLSPPLKEILDHVGNGRDTPMSIAAAGLDLSAVLLALTELEVMELLTRGRGGRYVPTEPARARSANG